MTNINKINTDILGTRIRHLFTTQNHPSKKLTNILSKLKKQLPLTTQDVKYLKKAFFRHQPKNKKQANSLF